MNRAPGAQRLFQHQVSLTGIIVLFITSLFLLQGCSEANDSSSREASVNTAIHLTVTGFTEGYAYFGGVLGDQYFTLDSLPIDKKGHILITRDDTMPQGMYYVNYPDRETSIQMLVDSDQEFSLTTTRANPIGDMEVDGSFENQLLYENLKFEEAYHSQYSPIRAQLNNPGLSEAERTAIEDRLNEMVESRHQHIESFEERYPDAFFTKFKLAGQNPRLQNPLNPDGTLNEQLQHYLYINDYWEKVDFSDGRLLRTPVYVNKLKSFFDRLVPQRTDSLIKYADIVTRKSMANDSIFKFTANFIGLKYKEPTFMGSDVVYAYMVKNFFTPELAFWSPSHELERLRLDADILMACRLGVKGMDIEAEDLNGNPVSLYDINAPITVLYLYNTDCENCQEETPKVREVYREWKSRGVEVFALATDVDKNKWKSYVAENGLTWVNAIDTEVKSQYNFKYHIDVTPEIYVLNQDKVIVGKDLHAFQLSTLFQQILE